MAEFDLIVVGSGPGGYIAAIRAAESAGYDVLIIDSLSHGWVGEGGVLDMHDRATSASNSAVTGPTKTTMGIRLLM